MRDKLKKNSDFLYRKFLINIVPEISPEKVLGVRMPVLRKMSAEMVKSGAVTEFLEDLPHKYHEENLLHILCINQFRSWDKCMEEIEKFLPYIDNWEVCDSLRPKCFCNEKELLIHSILRWIKSDHSYTVRFAIEMLMIHFLEEDFDETYLTLVANVETEAYYVKMMIAWYFATALAKRWNETIPYIEMKRLPLWVHTKTIQKARESRRISKEQKEYLKNIK